MFDLKLLIWAFRGLSTPTPLNAPLLRSVVMSGSKLVGRSSLLDALDQSLFPGSDRGTQEASLGQTSSFSSSLGEVEQSPDTSLDSQILLDSAFLSLWPLRLRLRNPVEDLKPSIPLPPPSYGVSRSRGDFNLYYDRETPVKPIDIGGPDQEEKYAHTPFGIFPFNPEIRLAEFVTKAIDNVSHGLSVRTAMEKLGLER